MEFYRFSCTRSTRFKRDRSLSATARPPASSAGLTMRLPDDNLPKLLRRAALAAESSKLAVVAEVFVFTVNGIAERNARARLHTHYNRIKQLKL